MAKTAKLLWLMPLSVVLASSVQWGCARTPQEREARFLAQGKKELLSKDYGRAVLDFRNAVAMTAQVTRSYYQLGWSLCSKAARDAAAALRKGIELNPSHRSPGEIS
jgi:hypothetical protein